MEDLLKLLRDQFYTVIAQTLVVLIALTIAIINRSRFPLLRYFPLYILSLLLSTFSIWFTFLTDGTSYEIFFNGLSDYIDYFFALIELAVFSNLFYQILYKPIFKKIILVTNAVFISFFVYKLIQDNLFYQGVSEPTQAQVYTLESIILLVLSLSYFVELFKRLPVLNLKNDPIFWISTGLLFFMICTLPFSLLENYIRKNYPQNFIQSYSIFHIFYILFFLLLIRAYFCRPENNYTYSQLPDKQ